jgi:hypothetical protein
MAVHGESLDRLRAAGRAKADAGQTREMAAYEDGRDDMWQCMADSTRLTTSKAASGCRRKLEK